MTLHKLITVVTILLYLVLLSCDRNKKTRTVKSFWFDTTQLSIEERTQRQVWENFRKAVTSEDTNTFRKLSLPCIYCPDCDAYLPKTQLFSPDSTEYVLTEKFVNSGGFQSVFNKKANDFYFSLVNVGWINISNAPEISFNNCNGLTAALGREVLQVSINDPNCLGEECSQTIFAFVNTEKGYKFFSMINVP